MTRHIDPVDLMAPILIGLLVAVWLGGGVTVDSTSADEVLQLLALPALLAAFAAWRAGPPQARLVRIGVIVAVSIAAVPALQLLPLPVPIWGLPQARGDLAKDLAQAGVIDALHARWSLSPQASEHGFWALLPALAAFLASLAVPAGSRVLVLKAMVLMLLANIFFAFFQAGLPPQSGLRLYPDSDPKFGGFLIHPNHHATALLIGMVLAVGLVVIHWRRREVHVRGPARHWLYAAFALFCLMLMPLTTSRAGMALALPSLAAALALADVVPWRKLGRNKVAMASASMLLLFVVIGAWSAIGWMAVDEVEGLRGAIAGATFDLGRRNAPLGSGIGSFVQAFQQGMPRELQISLIVNHAHNEYVQWWMTGGWVAMVVLVACLSLLAYVGGKLLFMKNKDSNGILASACFVAVCAVLVHSWVEYPLRTTTLMTMTATLAGFMLAFTADARSKVRVRRKRSGAKDAEEDGEGVAVQRERPAEPAG